MSIERFLIQPSGNEIIIREGKAVDQLPLKEPKIINISGDIKAISTFLSGRTDGYSSQAVDKNKAVVLVNKSAKTILLSLDPENHYGATVLAKLEAATELAPFGINQDKRFDRKSLQKLIKFSKYLFEDKAHYDFVCVQLSKIRMKSNTEINQAKDTKGNSLDSVETLVFAPIDFPKSFFLTIPIFKGFPAEKIEVEICYDVMDGSVSFWIESIGLRELTDSKIDDIFSDELASCAGFVIINQ
jgi:hypothetical protein